MHALYLNPAKGQLPGTPGEMEPKVGLMRRSKQRRWHEEEDEKRNENKNKILQDQEQLCEIT
jgi:hypothetical protein